MRNDRFSAPAFHRDEEHFVALVDRFFDGSLSQEQQQALEDELRGSRSQRDLFRAICVQDQMILDARRLDCVIPSGMHEDEDDFWIAVHQLGAKSRQTQMVDLTDELRRRQEQAQSQPMKCGVPISTGLLDDEPPAVVRHYVIPRPVAYGAVAALVATMVLLVASFLHDNGANVTEPQRTQVAMLLDAVDARWGDEAQAIAIGDPIFNERIELKQGYVTLRFDSEATVTLQGPCVIEPISASELRLIAGRLVGRCETARSRGFVVHTNRLRVVDVGTEFGVHAGAGGTSEVHVFEGEVDVAALRTGEDQPDSSPRRLLAGNAIRVDDQGTLSDVFEAEAFAFVRDTSPDAIDPRQRYARLVASRGPLTHWRGSSLVDGLLRNVAADSHHGMIMGQLHVTEDPQFGTVLDFPQDGANAYVRIVEQFESLMSGDYTMEVWIKPHRYQVGTIVSSRVPAPGGSAEDIAANVLQFTDISTESEKLAGIFDQSIRFMHRDIPSNDHRVGTNVAPRGSYQPDRWHHVVAVRRGAAMELYVNGELVDRDESAADWSEPVFILIGDTSHEPRPLQALLAELVIYERALSPAEVTQQFRVLATLADAGDGLTSK